DRRRRFASLPRFDAGGAEPPASVVGQPLRPAVGPADRLAVAERLLQVVADELVRLAALVEPIREALVQLGALEPRQRGIGDVADEHMVEAVAAANPAHKALLLKGRQASDLCAELLNGRA